MRAAQASIDQSIVEIPDINQVDVCVATNRAVAVKQLQAYLQHAGANINVFSNIAMACEHARHDLKNSVVLIDHFDPTIALEAQNQVTDVTTLHMRKRSLQDHALTGNFIEAEPLFYHDLILAVAIAVCKKPGITAMETIFIMSAAVELAEPSNAGDKQ